MNKKIICIHTTIVHNHKTSASDEDIWKQISKQTLFTDVPPSQVGHLKIVLSANNEILHFHNHSRKWLQSMPVKTALWSSFNAGRPTLIVAVATQILFSWPDSVLSMEGSAQAAYAPLQRALLAPVGWSAPLGAGVWATCSYCWKGLTLGRSYKALEGMDITAVVICE